MSHKLVSLYIGEGEYYTKTDADNVIAEKDKEIAELKDIDSKNRSAYYKDLSMMAKDVAHQKYRRCLAMVKWCYDRWIRAYHSNKLAETRFYVRWKKRWQELAEKFKEAK